MPAEPMESMLRPFNLVIPFTVQKGELTGTVLRCLGRGHLPGPEGKGVTQGHIAKLDRAGTQTRGSYIPVQASSCRSGLSPGA